MYIVTVKFEIKSEYLPQFSEAMENQARSSLEEEIDCHQFDVCYGLDRPGQCFLYEVYSDAAAFDLHLQTAHFKAFDELVVDWLESKTVTTFKRAWPDK